MNRIERDRGIIFYIGIEKARASETHNSQLLYRAVLREALKRMHHYCSARHSQFLIIMDEQAESFRQRIVTEASYAMFGHARRRRLIEPPIQAESHLFQTLQCADWICGLIGRIGCYTIAPGEYPELDWTEKYFASRILRAAPMSNIRQENSRLIAAGRALRR